MAHAVPGDCEQAARLPGAVKDVTVRHPAGARTLGHSFLPMKPGMADRTPYLRAT